MTGRCKTCRFWTQRCNTGFATRFEGMCECPKFLEEPSREQRISDGLFYYSTHDCGAEFNTGEDFACIHWEERPPEDVRPIQKA